MHFEGRLASGPAEICDLFHSFDTNEWDNDTLESDFYTQSVVSTRIATLTRTNVITTLTTVISTDTILILTLH
jgi:hypothetical protein